MYFFAVEQECVATSYGHPHGYDDSEAYDAICVMRFYECEPVMGSCVATDVTVSSVFSCHRATGAACPRGGGGSNPPPYDPPVDP